MLYFLHSNMDLFFLHAFSVHYGKVFQNSLNHFWISNSLEISHLMKFKSRLLNIFGINIFVRKCSANMSDNPLSKIRKQFHLR